MIEAIIFDFGNVFIDLDIVGTIGRTRKVLGFDIISETEDPTHERIFKINGQYEKGLISTDSFLRFYSKLVDGIGRKDVKNLWNSLLKDFPKHRLDFIKELKADKRFKLILLSNTNELHIRWIKDHIDFYNEFKYCFDAFYLSHEINLRKPSLEVFNFVIKNNNLNPNKTLFIDDTPQNTEAAAELGIHIWNINPNAEDITDLFKLKKELFV